MRNSLSAALCAAAMLAFAGSAAAVETFGYTGSVQTWTVAETGVYHFDVWGAQGGGGSRGDVGGFGAYLGGDIQLTAGSSFNVVVGGYGTRQDGDLSAGGGGATWVFVDAAAQPLAVAGGGAGTDWNATEQANPGTIASGDGSGGIGAGGGGGGGGGGWFGPGSDGGSGGAVQSPNGVPYGLGGQGPSSFAGGYTFGTVFYYPSWWPPYNAPSGGFGGGGGGGWSVGGGGGGYTGGDAGMGGTSYLDGGFFNVATTAGARSGAGLVTINFLGVPEPSTWAMLILGFFGLGASLRRRRTAQIGARRA